ncbi:DUF987 domain-containing protein [Escherichia coli]
MKIITRGEAMRIHQQHPASRLFPFCTGKYRWHGSAEAYTGREVQDIPGVLAVFAERRKDSFGPYVRLIAYSALFDHGLASKSDQRFASIQSTGNLTFSTAF